MNRLEQFKSLMDTVRRTLKSGQVFASDELITERAKICDQCPHLITTSTVPTCGKCGCKLRRKILVEGATCPLDKW